MKTSLLPIHNVAILLFLQEAFYSCDLLHLDSTMFMQQLCAEGQVFHGIAPNSVKRTRKEIYHNQARYTSLTIIILYILYKSKSFHFKGHTSQEEFYMFRQKLPLQFYVDKSQQGEARLKSVTIRDIKLHVVAMPLVELLKTSFGAEPFKSAIIVEVLTSEGLTGWGETALKTKPSYGSEDDSNCPAHHT